MSRLTGKKVGPYQLGEKIGQGGMGAVYRGTSESQETVAVKVLYPQYSDDPDYVKRFQREAEATRCLDHPNVVKLLDYGEDDNFGCYQAFELVEGQNLRELLGQGQLALDRALALTGQLLDGLGAAHEQRVLHRDIKPENLLLDGERLVISDFGVAALPDRSALTRTGFMPGTPEYMSPEQLGSEELTPASDLYSVGVVLYEMLTGETPFHANNVAEVMQRQLYQLAQPPSYRRPGLPQELDDLLLKALQKKARERFQSAQEMKTALGSIPSQERPPVSRPQPTPAPLPDEPVPDATMMVQLGPEHAPMPRALWLIPFFLLALGWWNLSWNVQASNRPPDWLAWGYGVGPAPLSHYPGWAARLQGAEILICPPDLSYGPAERAHWLAARMGQMRGNGVDPDRIQVTQEGDTHLLGLRGESPELFRVTRKESLTYFQREPETVLKYWAALLSDHLSIARGLEPRRMLLHERDHPLRPDGSGPVSPVLRKVYERARHLQPSGPLPTQAVLRAARSLDQEQLETYRQAGRHIPLSLEEAEKAKK